MARTQNEITRDERMLNLLENIFTTLNEMKNSINDLNKNLNKGKKR